ncbi:MAG TPA: phospholipid carrier-dependent glycosyltransferase, partial [Pyrinomonadaceae bacterium]|nr:phospholipid carrier-dependent glycosyltransferase [Pyrinomonadaceae bacterium]
MPEFTKTEHRRKSSVPASIWFAFGVLIVFFYFFGLTIPLLGPDEARYAQVAREMFERGDWITPTLGGFYWFEKPALLYWLQIASYNLFGVNEFAARFGSALCGLGVIACMWLLGRSAVRSEGPAQQPQVLSSDFGKWLALITASTLGIMVFARGASFDIAITSPITASIVSFFIFEQSRERVVGRYLALALFYVFIGLGLLAKGLIGAVFPIAIVSLFYLLSWRRPPAAFLFSLGWGGVLAIAIAAIWYWPMYIRHGYEFLD